MAASKMVMTLHAGAMVGLCFSAAPPGGDDYDGTKRVWAHVPGFDSLDTRTLEGGFPGGWFLCLKRDPNAVHQEVLDAGGPPEWMRADAWEWEARRLRARVAELEQGVLDLEDSQLRIELETLQNKLWHLSQGHE